MSNKNTPDANKKLIWVIRGAPGVGKSAVGRRLKKILPTSAIIEVDILRSMRSNINWMDEKIHKEAINQAIELAKSFKSFGLAPVIIIDTLLAEKLDQVTAEFGEDLFAITLVADDRVLLKRAKGRANGFENDRIISEMNTWFCRNQTSNCQIIDTTNLTADETVNKIIDFSNQNQPLVNKEGDKQTNAKHVIEENLVRPNGKLYLIRHSDPEKSYSGPYNLVPGPALSEKGILKAQKVRDFLKILK